MDFKIGYTTSIESQKPMDALIEAIRVETLGFDSVWIDDHFHPWFETCVDGKRAQSGFAWTWMGSTLQATKSVPLCSSVTSPILRYNPAIIAQAWATMGQMYPNRVGIAVGTGEALNEIPALGLERMPPNAERRDMVVEAVKLMNELWTSAKPVTFNGRFYKTRDAFLYTKPEKKIPVYFSGIGPKAVKAAASCADHLLTTVVDANLIKNSIMPGWLAGLKEAGRKPDDREVAFVNWYSIDEDYDKAMKSLKIWAACLDPKILEVHLSQECTDKACVMDEKIIDKMRICVTSTDELIQRIEEYKNVGVTHMNMCNASPDTYNGMDKLKEVRDYFKK